MDIIPAMSPKRFTSEITFSNDILIGDVYSKTLKLYGTEITTIGEVMDKLYMFQARF